MEDIILSGKSQTNKENIAWDHCNLKKKKKKSSGLGLLTTFVRKLPACFPIKVREAEQFPRLFSDAAKS